MDDLSVAIEHARPGRRLLRGHDLGLRRVPGRTEPGRRRQRRLGAAPVDGGPRRQRRDPHGATPSASPASSTTRTRSAYALHHATLLDLWRLDFRSVARSGRGVAPPHRAHDYPVWRALALVFQGTATVASGPARAGLAEIEQGFALYHELSTPPVFWPTPHDPGQRVRHGGPGRPRPRADPRRRRPAWRAATRWPPIWPSPTATSCSPTQRGMCPARRSALSSGPPRSPEPGPRGWAETPGSHAAWRRFVEETHGVSTPSAGFAGSTSVHGGVQHPAAGCSARWPGRALARGTWSQGCVRGHGPSARVGCRSPMIEQLNPLGPQPQRPHRPAIPRRRAIKRGRLPSTHPAAPPSRRRPPRRGTPASPARRSTTSVEKVSLGAIPCVLSERIVATTDFVDADRLRSPVCGAPLAGSDPATGSMAITIATRPGIIVAQPGSRGWISDDVHAGAAA